MPGNQCKPFGQMCSRGAILETSNAQAFTSKHVQVAFLAQQLGAAGLSEVECTTIDKFQGRDKELVALSLVKSNAQGAAGKLLADWRRINVALTRAKHKLVLVGCAATVSSVPLFDIMLDSMRSRGWVLGVDV